MQTCRRSLDCGARAATRASKDSIDLHQQLPCLLPEGGTRRRRGGRGRGTRPAGEQGRTRTARRRTAPAPVVVPVGADATVAAATDTTFEALGVPAPLVEVLAASGITAPFPIQAATLPDTLAGRDVLGRGRTGSGKTLAFASRWSPASPRRTARRQPQAARAR